MSRLTVGARVEFADPSGHGVTGVEMWQGTVVEDEPSHLRVRWDYKPNGALSYGRFNREDVSHLRGAVVERAPNLEENPEESCT